MPTPIFPVSPTLNQVFSIGIKNWTWDGVAWAIVKYSASESAAMASLVTDALVATEAAAAAEIAAASSLTRSQDAAASSHASGLSAVAANDSAASALSSKTAALALLKPFNPKGGWTAATPYEIKDVYVSAGIAYAATLAHVSTSVSADLAAGKVTVHQGATREDLAGPGGAGLLGFSQSGSGSGADARTVQDKLRESVSSLDFFIAGEADATAMFNRAIAYAKLHSIKCVTTPSGNYNTSGSIELHGNFGDGIEFRGDQATITCSGNVPVIDINCRIPDSPPQVRMNAYVHGFVLKGPGKANTSSRGVKASRGAGVKVENLSISGVRIGLHGYGNLISHYSDINITDTFMPMQFEPDGIEFAPNDIHFTRIKAFGNDRVCRMINFPNGSMTFNECELEGNNLAGNIADGVRVAEFFNAGKVTFNGVHMESNPGEFNVFFDGNAGAHLNVIGTEMIPGDTCGNVLFMANATGASSLHVMGSRITSNVSGKQIVLSTGVKATVIGYTGGAITGDLTNLTVVRNGAVTLGRAYDEGMGGNGITFPVIQNPSTNANTLDDYKEGAWTPVVTGQSTAGTATYAAQNGRYTKIGRQVFVECFVNWSAGTGTGDFTIDGLPFQVAASATYPAATIGRSNGFSWDAGAIPCANFEPGTTRISFLQQPSGGGAPSHIPYDSAAYLMVSGTYTV